jgi:hypothetical protein
MKLEDLIIPGILVVGAYILFSKFKDIIPKLPDLPPVTPNPVQPPWEPILPVPKDIPPEVKPYIPTPPSVIDYTFPPLAIPKAIGELNKPFVKHAPRTLDFLFPPLGIPKLIEELPKLIDVTFPQPKKEAPIRVGFGTKPNKVHPIIEQINKKKNITPIDVRRKKVMT